MLETTPGLSDGDNGAVSRSAANSDIPIKQLSPNTLGQIDGGKLSFSMRCLSAPDS